ncbi:MAG: Abi family protein [Nitrincola lacisaponensis]|uniref:Abi family protein n=1 Tax=Nitrincola lacisaponensis TaxID=267850 RepID=UPI003918C9B0
MTQSDGKNKQYNKPWLSYAEQLNILKSRGLIVTDDSKALEYLQRIGYYRLSGYWFPFRQRSELCCILPSNWTGKKLKNHRIGHIALDEFKPGSCFQNAVELYVFDKQLRLLVMDALERIEVAFRVDISHTLGRYGPFSYLEPERLFQDFAQAINQKTGITDHQVWLQKQAQMINRSKEEFIRHNKEKYGLPLPIWIACEVWDFGTLSTLYDGMSQQDQDEISSRYGISNGRVLASWLRSLNYLRNVCAHHSRLWNRNIVDQPKKPDKGEAPLFNQAWQPGQQHILARVFVLLCVIQHLLNTSNPNSSWWLRLKQLLQKFPDLAHIGLDLKGMGVIDGWEQWSWPQTPKDGQ